MVWDLPFRFWLSEFGEAITSLGQYFDINKEKLSLGREKINHTDSYKSRGNVIEEKAESANGLENCRIKDSSSENSEEKFELSEEGWK